jgi:LmbE family N-acetylglucosaminyl deacetylase
MAAAVILSPHRDDAVLSAWHVLAGPGDVGVLNVFTAAPPGAAVGWWDELTGATDAAVRIRERAAEDAEALALAGREAASLDFLDGQYRRSEQRLGPLAEAIAAAAPGEARLLAPAALGHHPDHELVRAAALALRERGRGVSLYADIPHAVPRGWPGWVADGGAPAADDEWTARLRAAGLAAAELEPEVHRLDGEAERRKRVAVACYRTQLGALEEDFPILSRPELLRYEVVWPLPPA